MRLVLVTALAAISFGVLLAVPNHVESCEKPALAKPTTGERNVRSPHNLRGDRDLHCHNTRRVGMKCHRGSIYNGPR